LRLLIDSSGARLVCALAEEGAERVVAELIYSGDDAKRPIDAVVGELLGHCTTADIYSIVVGTGPGSFIGTRTAISYANGFAAAGPGVELYGVSSLAAIAAGTGELPPPPVLRDARRGQWYLWSGDGSCAAFDEAGVLAALQQSGVKNVVMEVPQDMFEAWQHEFEHPVAQAPVPARDAQWDKPTFPATQEDFRIYSRRLPHWRMSGSIYFVTWRVHEAQAELPPQARDLMVENLRHFDGERYHLVGYVVMDDHVHVLVKPIERHELTKIMHTWKSFTANQIQKEFGWTGSIFQNESWDRVVRTEEELLEKVQYVLNNPRKRWPELEEYEWLYINLEAAGASWHAVPNSESGQARGPAPPVVNTEPNSMEQDIPLLGKLRELGITVTPTPGVTGEGLLRAMAGAEAQQFVEPIYLRGFT
jgi:putative transposase